MNAKHNIIALCLPKYTSIIEIVDIFVLIWRKILDSIKNVYFGKQSAIILCFAFICRSHQTYDYYLITSFFGDNVL